MRENEPSEMNRWRDFVQDGGDTFKNLSGRQKVGVTLVVLSAALVTRHFVRRGKGGEELKVTLLFPDVVSEEGVDLRPGDVAEVLDEVGVAPGALDRIRDSCGNFKNDLESTISLILREAGRRRCPATETGLIYRAHEALIDMIGGEEISTQERVELMGLDWPDFLDRIMNK